MTLITRIRRLMMWLWCGNTTEFACNDQQRNPAPKEKTRRECHLLLLLAVQCKNSNNAEGMLLSRLKEQQHKWPTKMHEWTLWGHVIGDLNRLHISSFGCLDNHHHLYDKNMFPEIHTPAQSFVTFFTLITFFSYITNRVPLICKFFPNLFGWSLVIGSHILVLTAERWEVAPRGDRFEPAAPSPPCHWPVVRTSSVGI